MKRLTQKDIDQHHLVLSAEEQEQLAQVWEGELASYGLASIERRYEYEDVTKVYVKGQRFAGKRVYPLDELDGYNLELAYYDEYNIDVRVCYDEVLASAMVGLLHKSIIALAQDKLDNPQEWNRSKGQNLRSYKKAYSWDKLKAEAAQKILSEELF